MDLGIFCKGTLDQELVDHCFAGLFTLGKNPDPTYLDWLMKAWGWTLAVAGLGLAIVHQVVTDHGGYLRLLDHNPFGSIVVIELPIV